MATITSTPTASSLTVSGNTQVDGTISWTKPEVPSGVTISSCVLTGTATASMSKGNATIIVNGTSVTSGSQFSVNLGTSNNTTSIPISAKGKNNSAKGTVSFSNLVYTVTYETSKPTYTVTFKDWDGSVLKTQTVEEGSSATAPSNPIRDGYDFTGWDTSFNNITSNLTVTAQYSIKSYTVTFKDWDGTVLKTQTVNHGSAATAPSDPTREGYEFTGWDTDFNNVISDLIVTARYKKAAAMIEWSGLGTIATNLKAHAGNDDYFHDTYKVNLDWNNESFDIVITGELNRDDFYITNPARIGDIFVGECELSIWFYDGDVIIYSDNYSEGFNYTKSGDLKFPYTISLTKNGIYIKEASVETTPVLISESKNAYEINQPISIIDDRITNAALTYSAANENPNYNLIFDLAVSEYSGQTEEPVLIAKYKFDKSIYDNLIPIFDDEFTNSSVTNVIVLDQLYTSVALPSGKPQSVDCLKCEIVYTNGTTEEKSFNYYEANIEYGYDESYDVMLGVDDYCVIIDNVNENNEWRAFLDYGGMDDKMPTGVELVKVYITTCNYEIVDEYLDTEDIMTTSTETMMLFNSDSKPDEYGVLTTEYEIENISTFSAGNIVTRSIYSNSLPTKMKFGSVDGSGGINSLLEVLYLNTSELTAMDGMFSNCSNLASLNLNDCNTSKVITMNGMLQGCQSLISLDANNLNTSNVTDMGYMFFQCKNLTSLNVNDWNVSNVSDIQFMFKFCNSLTELNLSSWNITNQLSNAYQSFCACQNLKRLNISNWDLSNARISSMFDLSNNLDNIIMNDSSYDSINKIIVELSTRASDSPGTLNIAGIDDISQVDVTTAESKFWNITNKELEEPEEDVIEWTGIGTVATGLRAHDIEHDNYKINILILL